MPTTTEPGSRDLDCPLVFGPPGQPGRDVCSSDRQCASGEICSVNCMLPAGIPGQDSLTGRCVRGVP